MADYIILNVNICFTFLKRGNNSLNRFQEAVEKALAAIKSKSEEEIKYTLEIVPSTKMPEFRIIDYLIWAVQRKLLRGERRYFDALRDKFETLLNLYE